MDRRRSGRIVYNKNNDRRPTPRPDPKTRALPAATVTRLRRDIFVNNEPVEAIIQRERLVPDVKIAELKSTLDERSLSEDRCRRRSMRNLLEMIPEDTARTYGVAPISITDNLLVIGMLHPDDAKAQDAMKFVARQNHLSLGVYLIAYGDWEAVIRRYSPYRSEIARAVQSLGVSGRFGQKAVDLAAATRTKTRRSSRSSQTL